MRSGQVVVFRGRDSIPLAGLRLEVLDGCSRRGPLVPGHRTGVRRVHGSLLAPAGGGVRGRSGRTPASSPARRRVRAGRPHRRAGRSAGRRPGARLRSVTPVRGRVHGASSGHLRREGRAEALPFEDACSTARWPSSSRTSSPTRLGVHASSAGPAPRRCRRSACVWDFAEGMQMLRLFWDAALTSTRQPPTRRDPALRARGRDRRAGSPRPGSATSPRRPRRRARPTRRSRNSGRIPCRDRAGRLLLRQPGRGEPRVAVREELFQRVGSPTGSVSPSPRKPDAYPATPQ